MGQWRNPVTAPRWQRGEFGFKVNYHESPDWSILLISRQNHYKPTSIFQYHDQLH